MVARGSSASAPRGVWSRPAWAQARASWVMLRMVRVNVTISGVTSSFSDVATIVLH
jgi:hypothetical protein